MLKRLARKSLFKVLIPGGSLLLLGSCPLTDSQITSIGQSAISTGLNTIVRQIFESLFTLGTTA
jgi:hypothetical protein